MCRYAWHHYRDHFACFRCRKAFKHWQWEGCERDTPRGRKQLRPVPREVVCPQCSRPMADMGLDFKAPPRDDREAWKILEILYRHGFTFHNCGCGGMFIPPRRLRHVPDWLSRRCCVSEGEALSRRFAARAT